MDEISTFKLILGVVAVVISFAGLSWGIFTWMASRLSSSITEKINNMGNLILAKLETYDARLMSLKANGTDYSHSLNDRVETVRQTLYTEFYRRDEAEKDFGEIKNKLDRVEQKLDHHRSAIEDNN